MNEPQGNPPFSPIKRTAQTRGPLPLSFHIHRGRVVVKTETDHSIPRNPKAGTKGRNGFEWPKVEREKPFPTITGAVKTVEGVAAMVTTTADGTPYAVAGSGAIRRLAHTDDGYVLYRRLTKAEKKAAKKNAKGGVA